MPRVAAGTKRPGRFRVLLVALALSGLAAAGALILVQSRSTPSARPPVPARAAYVADDGHVYVVSLAGGDARRVSQIAGVVVGEPTAGWELPTGRWPTWAPDGQRLAFVRELVANGDVLAAAQLWTVSHDGTDLRKVWEAPDQEPIYLAWAPNGAAIALLVQSADDLELILVDAAGAEPARRLAHGSPFYFTWAADSRSLLLHVGSAQGGDASPPTLGTLRLGPPDVYRPLGIEPGRFRTPGWSADGRVIAFVADGPDGAPAVSLVRPEGGDVTRLAPVSGQTAFALTPDGTRVAWSSRSERDRLAYDGLEVATTDGRARTRVTDSLVLAFYWSPDARQLAFVTASPGGQAFAWNVADEHGAHPRQVTTFTPSLDQFRTMAFFDQYAISHGLWAPDGSALVYVVGLPGEQAVPGQPSPGAVTMVPSDGSGRARTLSGGSFVAMPVP